MANPYLFPTDENPERVKTSIRLTKAETEMLALVAEVWNGLDQEFGRKRRSKWKTASLMEFLVRGGIAEFWTAIGGEPKPKETLEQLVKRAVEHMNRTSTEGEKKR